MRRSTRLRQECTRRAVVSTAATARSRTLNSGRYVDTDVPYLDDRGSHAAKRCLRGVGRLLSPKPISGPCGCGACVGCDIRGALLRSYTLIAQAVATSHGYNLRCEPHGGADVSAGGYVCKKDIGRQLTSQYSFLCYDRCSISVFMPIPMSTTPPSIPALEPNLEPITRPRYMPMPESANVTTPMIAAASQMLA